MFLIVLGKGQQKSTAVWLLEMLSLQAGQLKVLMVGLRELNLWGLQQYELIALSRGRKMAFCVGPTEVRHELLVGMMHNNFSNIFL